MINRLKRLRPTTRIRLSFLAVVALAFLFVAGFTWQTHKTRELAAQARAIAAQGKQAHDAICVLRADLSGRITAAQKEIDNTQDYIDKHPGGVLGFTAQQIEASLNAQRDTLTNQRATFAALAPTKCDPPTPAPAPATPRVSGQLPG